MMKLRFFGVPVVVIALLALLFYWAVAIAPHLDFSAISRSSSLSQAAAPNQVDSERAAEVAQGKVSRLQKALNDLNEAESEEEAAEARQRFEDALDEVAGPGMQDALRESPNTAPAVTERLAEIAESEAASAERTLEAGNTVESTAHADNAIRIGVAAEAIRGTVDSRVYSRAAQLADANLARVRLAQQRALELTLGLGGLSPASP